jgi:hypothetical protein
MIVCVSFLFDGGRVQWSSLATARTTTSSSSSFSSSSSSSLPIPIQGWGSYRYVYEPSYLPIPQEANVEHAHGIVIYRTTTSTSTTSPATTTATTTKANVLRENDDWKKKTKKRRRRTMTFSKTGCIEESSSTTTTTDDHDHDNIGGVFNIIITYKDVVDPTKCLLQWDTTNLTKVGEFLGPTRNDDDDDDSLCRGIPHGLISVYEEEEEAEEEAADDDEDDDDFDRNGNNNNDTTRSRNDEQYTTNTNRVNHSMTKNGRTVLYHANNEQLLHKTTADGEIVWTVQGSLHINNNNNNTNITTASSSVPSNFNYNNYNTDDATNTTPYRPTWFAAQPGSPYLYLADGYGSSKIYVLRTIDGSYTGYSFGGYGTHHGMFQTCHSISWDDRYQFMVVSDRENHRLEYYHIDPSDPSIFLYAGTISYYPLLQRPCNVRIRWDDTSNDHIHPTIDNPHNNGGATTTTTTKIKHDDSRFIRWNRRQHTSTLLPPGGDEDTDTDTDTDDVASAIVPFLEGTVGILNFHNDLIGLVNVSDTLGDLGFQHPHDVHFVPNTNGDFILVTWNPGRIGYFRRISSSSPSPFHDAEEEMNEG